MLFASVGVVSACWLGSEAWSARDVARARTYALEHELADKQMIAANHDAAAEQLDGLRQMLQLLMRQVPEHFDRAALEASLRDQAARAGLRLADLRVGAEVRREGFYGQLRVDIAAQGPIASLVALMHALQDVEQVHQVAAFNLESGASTQDARATLVLAYFRYLDEDGR
jgi:Tfp pilus assembly protein PilO